mmetsp:Transcript_96357/g.281542  ORF Transcript_96357/g.281542 Transcript_96357/m.281542 type:complete len:298 (+) Transcript_96357:613-1506(+)
MPGELQLHRLHWRGAGADRQHGGAVLRGLPWARVPRGAVQPPHGRDGAEPLQLQGPCLFPHRPYGRLHGPVLPPAAARRRLRAAPPARRRGALRHLGALPGGPRRHPLLLGRLGQGPGLPRRHAGAAVRRPADAGDVHPPRGAHGARGQGRPRGPGPGRGRAGLPASRRGPAPAAARGRRPPAPRQRARGPRDDLLAGLRLAARLRRRGLRLPAGALQGHAPRVAHGGRPSYTGSQRCAARLRPCRPACDLQEARGDAGYREPPQDPVRHSPGRGGRARECGQCQLSSIAKTSWHQP